MGDYFTFTRLVDSIDTVLSGAGATFEIVIFSFLIALAAGILLAVIRIRKIPVAAQIVAVFNSFMRGTPMIVQIYLVYYGLPFFMDLLFGVDINRWSKMLYVILAIGLNNAAFFAEIFRSALASVSVVQLEAGFSIGLTWMQAFRRVVFPQAFRVALPSLVVQFISLLQSTALAYMFGVTDMMMAARKYGSKSGHSLEAYCVVMVLFVAICVVLELSSCCLDKRLNTERRV